MYVRPVIGQIHNAAPSLPVYYPDQSPNPASQGYQDQPYERSSPARGNTNPSDPSYNQDLAVPSRGPSSRHDYADQRQWKNSPQPVASAQNPHAVSNITPGADNFSNEAAGGVAGIAYSVADSHARESGVEAMRGHQQQPGYGGPYQGGNFPNPINKPTANPDPTIPMSGYGPQAPPAVYETYANDPYSYSRPAIPALGVVDPNTIADDGDDGLDYRRPARNSMLSLNSNRSGARNAATGAAAAGAAGGAAASGLFRDGASAPTGGRAADILAEKESPWLKKQHSGRKRWKWAVIVIVFLIVIGAILGGVLGTVLKKGGGSSPSKHGQSADDDTAENGDLSINSAEIKALMNNKNLHKVFPGMDYTPINTQYPECLHDPPSQNNITRDLAVISQLTNTVRLYGTDCNQTQMVVHAIQRLKLDDTMKVWLGVWQDNNATTNRRQLDQMWDILDEYGEDPFAGLIVANEILFREQMTNSQLSLLLTDVKTNLTGPGVPVTDVSDYIMGNIHPFFSGVNAKGAAEWTMNFWEDVNGVVWKSDKKKNIIAEIGWPSQGGTNCGDGTATGCPNASVAGVTELNKLLEDWVCPALSDGTQYFWFSAFDEPWKVSFNEKNKEWEDHWGLFDVNRNLKQGITIPDCGGKTI
ncbi:unnamed protein product [Parascedosporium putredinis]|uniref:glucan endo-1,3-beta-D-glucosidase n=1 Tax=Parascedosporium putredinis TaxID=1442378 RepID=A0A9P1H1F9_9PEZI|nr:unnamed protein product [Parascedosporium putredinis]CAI7993708.1 unnamed protein product [Parascedosporium putredinis]